MLFPVHYTTAKYNALKAFKGYNDNDFYVLDILVRYNAPIGWKALYGLVLWYGNTISSPTLTNVLRRCTERGYVERQQVGTRVLYNITSAGIQQLHAYANELDRVFKLQAKRFDLE